MIKDLKAIIYRILWNSKYKPTNNEYRDLFYRRPNQDFIHYKNAYAINDRVYSHIGRNQYIWSSDVIRSFKRGTYINIPLPKNY